MSRRFVVEADGGSRGNPGPAGYGAVVRDATSGEVLAETAESIGKATNNVAEYQGLIAGLRAAHALDPDATVLVRMDSKLVVEQMSGRWKIKHPDMRPLAMTARDIFPAGAVRYEWMPRERNKHADRLANEAMDAAAKGRTWQPEQSRALDAEPSVRTGPEPTTAPVVGWGEQSGGTTFVLLRHGETALTREKRFSGSGSTGDDDPELAPAGVRQAEAAALALEKAPDGRRIDAVVASPLRRCRQTAQAVADRLGLDVRIEAGLRETDFAQWEGLTFGEVRERYPQDLTQWMSSAQAQPTGGGESFTAVARRAALARDKIIARYAGKTVLIVSHVTPIKSLLRLALGAPTEAMFRMELSPAALSVVTYYNDGNASVRLFNDTGHLRAAAADGAAGPYSGAPAWR
ncbi:bifunctional RNase H/acid phosphatase [Streptomyces sp. AA0539]|uniref:bifunctional RNase H/acid phosphatase n=1 Tax=Streptomyces sp. AA0539 TaxID=1210045 RepID=UPI0002D3AAFF|nr:bifunctional RNase H/acid phosphatase [Streptomyces sp. AA0539]